MQWLHVSSGALAGRTFSLSFPGLSTGSLTLFTRAYYSFPNTVTRYLFILSSPPLVSLYGLGLELEHDSFLRPYLSSQLNRELTATYRLFAFCIASQLCICASYALQLPTSTLTYTHTSYPSPLHLPSLSGLDLCHSIS